MSSISVIQHGHSNHVIWNTVVDASINGGLVDMVDKVDRVLEHPGCQAICRRHQTRVLSAKSFYPWKALV